jgi:hypothetical protein
MVQYTVGSIPKDAPVSFAALVRQQAHVHTRQPYVYPFAFPGNLLAAWRAGIPLGRYDDLSSEGPRDEFEIRLDRSGDRFLLNGWGPAGATADGPFRVIVSDRATLVFLLKSDARDLAITVQATLRSKSAAPGGAELGLHVNDLPAGTARLDVLPGSEARLVIPGADVSRIVRHGYNRLTIVPRSTQPVAVHRVRISPVA